MEEYYERGVCFLLRERMLTAREGVVSSLPF